MIMAKKKVVRKKTTKSKVTKKKPVKKVVRQRAPKKAEKPIKKSGGKKAVKEKLKKGGPRKAYLSLGSNVGDREEYIEQAIFLLEKVTGLKVTKRSTNYETAPEGSGTSKQPPFINAAVEVVTTLSPEKLLKVCQDIEATLGREKEVEWGPRTIDIDILLYEGAIRSDDSLQIPHPLLHERMFVLKPLREIAPNLVHPMLDKTIDQLYQDRKAEMGDKYDDDLPGFKQIKEGFVDDYERW
jgi:2-amino-4-hydroxy-6-hydroxymethyldihydropteridine diphosphokinase